VASSSRGARYTAEDREQTERLKQKCRNTEILMRENSCNTLSPRSDVEELIR
jgi:hypothetical protein